MKSHAILRTNVGLTTNAKIMVTDKYSLYLDAIISNSELSSTKYKKLEFNKDTYWDEILPYFFRGTAPELAFFVKDDLDSDNMSSDFANQYDDIYEYGARNIVENKDYVEEFEYFAPLYISKNNLPSNFIIFRIDGPGLTTIDSTNFKTEIIDKLKFIKNYDLSRKTPLGEWLEKNFTKNKTFPISPFYMDFRNLEFSSWYGIDFEDGGYSEKSFMFDSILEFEQTYHDYEKLVYDGFKNNKIVFPNILNFSFLFDDEPATPSSLRKWSLNRYLGFYLDELNLVKYVSPYLLPTIKTDATIDANNILSSPSGTPFVESFKKEDYPYIEIGGNFYKIVEYLEEGSATLTKVPLSTNTFEERLQAPISSKWKIISQENLGGRESEINKNLIFIEYTNSVNVIKYIDGSDFEIDGWDGADVWLIEIGDVMHKLSKVGSEFRINTDYAFYQSASKFDYYINDPDPNYRKTIKLEITDETEPVKFAIYKCKFTDIKDFDYSIVDTDYSKFEYLLNDELTETDETRMYVTNYDSESSPKDLDDFKINGIVVNIPASSEYTANSETFRLVDNELSTLWKKNPQRVKWGFQKSVSANDYPYLLNNSFLSEDFNRTTNPFANKPDRKSRNLDYFLTINPDSDKYSWHSLHVIDSDPITFESYDTASTFLVLSNISNIGAFSKGDRIRITGVSTNIIDTIVGDISLSGVNWNIRTEFTLSGSGNGGNIQNLTRTTFSLDKYLNRGYDLDYFEYFFGKKTTLDSGKILKETKKWSLFNSTDFDLPNITLFRGLKFSISDVNSIKLGDGKIESINKKNKNSYEDWKFAILASKNNYSIQKNSDNKWEVFYNDNGLSWQIIDDWKHGKLYATSSIVRWENILWTNSASSTITDPNIFPYNSTDWSYYTVNSIFFNPNRTTNNMTGGINYDNNIPPLVYNSEEYYYSNGQSGNTFWIPGQTYLSNEIVIYRNKKWISNSTGNTFTPGSNNYFDNNGVQTPWWTESSSATTIWTEVEIWSPEKTYDTTNSLWSSSYDRGHYVLHQDVIWMTVESPQRGIEPINEPKWKRIYSIRQDTRFEYNDGFSDLGNPIIEINNKLYRCIDNRAPVSNNPNVSTTGSTLENGVNIFINKKWKNVLINIYINDNSYTLTNSDILGNYYFEKDFLSNTNRDSLYTELFERLVASNVTAAINDPENFYDFSDKIKYIIINEDLTLDVYDFGDLTTIQNLPVILEHNYPDSFNARIFSNIVEPTTLSISEIKPKRNLEDGNITSLSELNFYDGKHLAVTINRNETDPILIPNFSKLRNTIYNELWRHSGYYSPIFNKIELFMSPTLDNNYGNYKFDTSYTYFGKIKERIILKVSRKGNILKLRNRKNEKSIYPMLDEFGYTVTDYFIFKSTWDFEYYTECNEIPQVRNILSNQTLNYNPNLSTQNNTQSDL